MKAFKVAVGLISGLLLVGLMEVQAQSKVDKISTEQALPPIPFDLPLVAPSVVPTAGTFYSAQHLDGPPLPFNPFPELPVYSLGGACQWLLIDDRTVDYDALREEARAEAEALAELEALLSPRTAARTSLESLQKACSSSASGRPFLTNLVAILETNETVTAAFDIAGGTNFVPCDILMTTNLATNTSAWSWLGFGYTSNRYSFSNQPGELAFYALGKPEKTSVIGWGNNVVGESETPAGLTNAVAVAGGQAHSLALLSDGTVRAWGWNGNGETNVPGNATNVSMITAGWYHNLALRTNGQVIGWGLNSYLGAPIAQVPAGMTNCTVVSAQGLHSLALRADGTVAAWGYSSGVGETNVPSDLSNVVAIAAGYQHNLAVKADGNVVAWGGNTSGQCTVPAGATNVWDVAAGMEHSVALRRDGTVICWGGNTHGESTVPAGLSNVVAIAAGGDLVNKNSYYTVALKSDGTLVCWGIGEVLNPQVGMNHVIAIGGGGRHHALAVRTGPRTPVVVYQPADQYQLPGGSVTFTARGEPGQEVQYQWQYQGTNIPGATGPALTLTNTQMTSEGAYHLRVSNEAGSVTSSNAYFHLVVPPVMLTQSQPTNRTVYYQSEVALGAGVAATGQYNGFPLSCQWRLNGTNIAGATNTDYSFFANAGTEGEYTLIASNAAGSDSLAWQVGIDYGTLAYYLATNTAAYTNGHTASSNAMMLVTHWTYGDYFNPTNGNLSLLTNAVWSTNCWLHGVKGLSATAIAVSNYFNPHPQGAQCVLTMVSPRHYLAAAHNSADPPFKVAFLDTNNVFHWRTVVERVNLEDDTTVGIMDEDLPASVGFLPVLPPNYTNYLPTSASTPVQSIGMNRFMQVFGQPNMFGTRFVTWNWTVSVPFGLGINWNLAIGDSSLPERLLIDGQMILVSSHFKGTDGPNYAFQFDEINQAMNYLSTNNNVTTNYRLTTFPITNWPTIR